MIYEINKYFRIKSILKNTSGVIEASKEYLKKIEDDNQAICDDLMKKYNVDNENEFEIPFIKKSNSLLEQSKYQNLHKNFDCSANLLRQCTEKLLCKFLPQDKA